MDRVPCLIISTSWVACLAGFLRKCRALLRGGASHRVNAAARAISGADGPRGNEVGAYDLRSSPMSPGRNSVWTAFCIDREHIYRQNARPCITVSSIRPATPFFYSVPGLPENRPG